MFLKLSFAKFKFSCQCQWPGSRSTNQTEVGAPRMALGYYYWMLNGRRFVALAALIVVFVNGLGGKASDKNKGGIEAFATLVTHEDYVAGAQVVAASLVTPLSAHVLMCSLKTRK